MSNVSVLHGVSEHEMSKLRPVGDRVLLERCEKEAKSPGGILLPDSAQEQSVLCTVLAVGKGEFKDGHNIPIDLRVGQKVVIPKYAGSSIKAEGNSEKLYVVVRYSDILLKIEN